MEKLIHETFNCALGDTGEYEGHSVIRTENGDVWYADMPGPNDLEVEGHAEIVRRVNLHDALMEAVNAGIALLDDSGPGTVVEKMARWEKSRAAIGMSNVARQESPLGSGGNPSN